MEMKASGSKSVFKPALRRFSTGELIMRASPAAADYVVPPRTAQRPFLDALSVSSNARLMVKALGGPAAVKERQNVLAMHILQFGKYKGQTFKWLLENDLGWVTGVVAVFEYKDTEIPNNPHSANKFRLVEYVRMFPEVTHHMLEKKKIVAEKERQKAEAPKVSIPSQTAPRPSPSAEDVLKDEDLVEAANNIETMEAISGDVMYSAWKQVLDPCDLKWISQALFRVNRQGKAEMKFDSIDRMWFYPPKPALVCTQPPAMDRYFARPIFLWMPKKLWRVRLTCPGKDCNGQELISSGIYRTLRRVLSLSGFYYMATEYLECPICKKKLSSWNQDLLDQLDVGHRLQFPCILTRLMACDLEVVKMLRQRGLGNSVARLRQNLAELHGEENLKRTAHYLSDCQTFSTAQKRGLVTRTVFTPPPTPPRVPSCQWLTSVYCQDVLSRLEEVKAAITSVYGRILKVDSTKKVAKKLQGSAAETAAWATNVGNEHGQVLMSVLTAGEGAGLDSMFEGIQRRYSDANVNPPEVVYVDRDCCGSNFIGKKFQSWSATQVRLDIWHFMRRISSACTTESHALYPQFMRRLSGCIFYWSEEDLAALKLAKETQAMKEGVTVQGKEQEWLTKKELALHCRRTTRSPVEIRQQINELLEVFSGEQGRDMLGTPLLDADKARDVWESQQRHVDCIQDPPNVSLYTQTGTLKKGTKTLPTYRCARGSTSLESFHLHLNRFIPGTSANDVNYQAFLLEGLYRWNQDRASQAVEVEAPLCHTYSGLLRHAVNQLSQTVLGNPLDPAFQHPRAYTGELIGVEYLYSQTGKVLQAIPEELAEEDQPTEEDQDHDEGFEEEEAEDDLTVPDANFEVAAVRPTGKPAASAVGPEASTARPPSSPRAVWQRGSPRSPARAVRSPRTPTPAVTPDSWTPTKDQPTQQTEGGVSVPLEEENSDEDQLPEPTSGMQPVHDLADYLLQLRDCRTLTRTQQEQLVVLWDKLEPHDQRPAVFQPRTRSSPKGRFMASKTGRSPVKANVEKTKRSFVGTGTGPASYPDANRYMEALVKRLTEVYPSAIRRPDAPTITRWSLIQAAYNRIREVVMEDPRVSALTGIQLLPLNQATLILWDRRRQARQEEVVLSQGIEISDPPVTAPQPLPPPLSKPATLVTSSAPAHRYQLPPNTAGQSRVRIRSPPRMPSPQLMPSPPRIIRHPVIAPGPVQYRYVLTQVPPNQTPQPAIPQYQEPEFTAQALPPLVSGSTACYRRKVEKRKRMGEYVRQYNPRRGPNQCFQCKKPKVAPSHRQYFGNWYCEETTGESYEDWVERMRLRGYTSRKRRQPPPDEEDPTADPP